MNCALLCFTYCVRSFWVSSCECSGLFLPASCFSRAQATVANVVKAKQKSFLLYPPFSFLRERKGFYLRSVAFLCFGFASQLQSRPAPVCLQLLAQRRRNPTYPAAREKLLHCVQVNLALSRRKCKFDIFKIRVSVDKICKFGFKFERKTIRRSIFSLDEAETTEARERTSRP